MTTPADTPKKTTSRGRKPQDHQEKAGTAAARLEREQEIERLLADAPDLPAATQLRMRERAKIRSIMLRAEASHVFDDDGDGIEVDTDSDDAAMIEKIEALDDLCAQVDEWAESIAADRAAYVQWARGKSYDVWFALLSRYGSAVGESNGS